MKKITLFLIFALVGTILNAQNVNIPDTAFKNALLEHGTTITGTDIAVIDTSGDGEIQVGEAQAYTGVINVDNKSISDLTGIEAFTSVTELSFAYNNISSIDLSQNTALTYLSCSQNSLTSLNVSQNTSLVTIHCHRNAITSLDLSQNTALTTLACYSNQLTSLNVSNNTQLEGLFCGNNKLSSLNVSQNTALIRLDCSNNELTSLDVSSLTQLQFLFCTNNNQLTSLNLANGNNGALAPNLYYVDVRANLYLNCVQHDSGFNPNTAGNWYKSAYTFWSANCSGASHSRLYVDASVTGGTGTGDSWANAFTNLYDALDSIGTNVTEIWVAKGTYAVTNNTYTIGLNNIKIYGGFAGTETYLEERDLNLIHTTNASIISGDTLGDDNNVIDFDNTTRENNAQRLMKIDAHNVTLDGLTISGAYADASSGPLRAGAGVFVSNFVVDFTLKNCLIKENVANWGAGLQYQPQEANSKLIIDACKFENNLTSAGASAFYTFPMVDTLSVIVSNSLFVGNKTKDDVTKNRVAAGASAGWIRAYNSGAVTNATIVNNTFVNNENQGTDATSDFATLALSINDGTFDSINIANNIFWGNTKNAGDTALAIGRVRSAATLPSFNIYNSIDENGFSNINATNLHSTSNANPNLSSNFKLQTGSPAINAGDNAKIPSYISADLAGNARIHNTTIDMGCYEFASIALVTSIIVQGQNGDSAITTNGGTLQMEAIVLPAHATDKTYTWSVSNGTGSATIDANGLLTAVEDGTVIVTATANDASGVSGSATITISNQSVGINDVAFSDLHIYPNPAKGIVNIKVQENLENIQLIDVRGKIIKVFDAKSRKLDVSNIERGIYFIQLNNHNKQSIQKIVLK